MPSTNSSGFLAIIEQDSDVHDGLFVQLPPSLCETQDWRPGDVLSHEVLDGAWIIVNESVAMRKSMAAASTPTPMSEEMPLFIVETVMSHRIRYAIRARSAEHANDVVTMREAEEFDQNPLDEAIFSTREVSLAEYLTAAELPTDPLRKVALIHTIDYGDAPAPPAEQAASVETVLSEEAHALVVGAGPGLEGA